MSRSRETFAVQTSFDFYQISLCEISRQCAEATQMQSVAKVHVLFRTNAHFN